MHAARTTTTREIDYPSSDGKPMAESDLHRNWMFTIIQRLERHFLGQRVYVSGNLLIYYQEGDRRKCVAPDTFVVEDCKPGPRTSFLIWKEKRSPSFVLETTSKKTRRVDAGKKKNLYAELRIAEYFLYDPTGDWLKPHSLQGNRLKDGVYESIPPDADGSILSTELGVRFKLEDGDLAMFDAATGERLLSEKEWRHEETRRADEAQRHADEAQRHADEARRYAQSLEAEVAQLREAVKKINGHKRKNGK